jgi:hypothetical protein
MSGKEKEESSRNSRPFVKSTAAGREGAEIDG